jgi:hypothetical protein
MRDHVGRTVLVTIAVAALVIWLLGELGVILAIVGVIVVVLACLPESVTSWKRDT